MHQTPQQNCLIAGDSHTAPSTPSSLVLQDHQHKCVCGDLKAQSVNRKILSLARPNVPPVPGRVLTYPNNSKYLSRKGGNTFLEGQYIIQLFGIDSETEVINFWLYPKSTTTASTIGIHIQRVTDFSQEGGRQQMDSSKSKGSGCSNGNLPLQNPQSCQEPRGPLPLSKFCFLEGPIHTYPLLPASSNPPPRFASSLQVQVPGLSPSKTGHPHS